MVKFEETREYNINIKDNGCYHGGGYSISLHTNETSYFDALSLVVTFSDKSTKIFTPEQRKSNQEWRITDEDVKKGIKKLSFEMEFKVD